MLGGEAIRQLGESRLHVLAGTGEVWRSPLFLFSNHGLLFLQTSGYNRPRPTAERPPTSRRFVDVVTQQVNGEWEPLHITGFGGGGDGARTVHWIEVELPDSSASVIRISYGDPALAAVDDQFIVAP